MSRRRRDDADIHGLLNVCKARGFTSHDVVAVVRRALGTRRVGHTGTLDPMAEGVLPICVGRYTRLVELLTDTEKGYYAEIELGARTTTDDAEGEIIERRPVPELTPAALERVLDRFRGPISQVPPAYSAIKVAGRRAYDLARRGDAPELAARPVTIHRLDLTGWDTPRLALTVACSKGTYVRSLARDLGENLGCGAHLTRLVRLWVGSCRLEDAVSLDEIAQAASGGHLQTVLQSADRALGMLPAIIVPDARLADIGHGRPWPASPADGSILGATPGPTRVYDTAGRLLGLAEYDHKRAVWQPRLALIGSPLAETTADSILSPQRPERGGIDLDG
ncbi:MAG: tRNA pseudouridine(55) synthase TruB [Chloroflexota bacterium]